VTVARKLVRYKFDLAGVQEVRWRKKGHCKSRGLFLLYGNKKENQLEKEFFVHHRTVSAVKRVEFVSDKMS